jgi:hypothetical protein
VTNIYNLSPVQDLSQSYFLPAGWKRYQQFVRGL